LPDVFDAIIKYRATHVLLTPSIIGLMLRLGEDVHEPFQTGDFRFVISVAASLSPKIWSDFQEITGKKIVNVYGLSETGNNLFAGPDQESYRIGSIGKPVDCRAAIVREDGARANPGETGELLLQGASITGSYLAEPIVTTTLEQEQWFATGDLAYRDENDIYWLVGRKKNIIIVGGRNVYPDEINNVLLSHPAVLEAATLGLIDEMWGERVVSCVVSRSPVSISDLLNYAAQHLTDYKVPREIHLRNQLPKGRSGKILLNELARELQDHGNAEKNTARLNLEAEVLNLASQSFRTPPSELSLKTAPANCSRWDSVAHMDFVTNLESRFGIELLPREVIQITTLDAAVRIVRAKMERVTGQV
jgi:long-chain acyl-CoA synthetase